MKGYISVVTFGVLVLLIKPISVQAQPPRVADGNTTFHRVYVIGPGKSHTLWHEDNGLKDDQNELENDLEQSENQAADSTSRTLEKPTKQQLEDALNALKAVAQPGDEVTLHFGGHGNGGSGGISDPGENNDPNDEWIWLNDQNGNEQADYPDEVLTDDELADMLEGFQVSVTIVVIIDSCYGGGFTGGADDIQETNHVAVIGTEGEAPVDPPGVFGGSISTLTEDTADGGGERNADANEDGKVTAEELKNWLRGRTWPLGPPDDSNSGKIKNGKSKIIGLEGAVLELPSITPDTFTPPPDSNVILTGRNFASNSDVDIKLVKSDLTQLPIGYAQTDHTGYFVKIITIPSGLSGQCMLVAEDTEANLDWDILSVPVTGPALSGWGLIVMVALLLSAGAIVIRRRIGIAA